jgi:hypothetical protein
MQGCMAAINARASGLYRTRQLFLLEPGIGEVFRQDMDLRGKDIHLGCAIKIPVMDFPLKDLEPVQLQGHQVA